MKTMISALILVILSMPALGAMDNPPLRAMLEEEAYVNDIPFDTRSVVMSLTADLQDEAYVDDIPFNTMDVILLQGVSHAEESNVDEPAYEDGRVFGINGIQLEEEAYVDDIPFNTLDVIALSNVKMQDESYIDDIPFDTDCIVKSISKDRSTWAKCLIPIHGNRAQVNYRTNTNEVISNLVVRF